MVADDLVLESVKRPYYIRPLSGAISQSCVDDTILARFLAGELDAQARRSVTDHFNVCAKCQGLVAALMRGDTRVGSLGGLRSGDLLGRYKIVEEIGSGAMGVVYTAEDPSLGRLVALKVVQPALGDDVGRERLLREAQAMARLRHANVIRVYDVGVSGQNLFIAMELVHGGRTLRQWLAQEPRTWRQVRDVFVAAGRGLNAAHLAGVVHRDFKPDNVLVDEDGSVFVTDFGLARKYGEADDRPGNHSTASPVGLTATGAVVGTPAYMAPEQFSGDCADARSDQFAFCVALYEALAGKRPFSGDSITELAERVGTGTLPEQPTGKGVPSTLWAAVEQGLRPLADERHPSMEPLLALLLRDPNRLLRTTFAVVAIMAVVAGSVTAAVLTNDESKSRCERAAEAVHEVWNTGRAHRIKTTLEPGLGPLAAQHMVAMLTTQAQSLAEAREQTCSATFDRGEQSEPLLDARMGCLDERVAELSGLVAAIETREGEQDGLFQAIDQLADSSICSLARAEQRLRLPPPSANASDAVRSLRKRLARAAFLGRGGDYEGSVAAIAVIELEARQLAYDPLLAEVLYQRALIASLRSEYEQAEYLLLESTTFSARARYDFKEAQAWVQLVYVVGYQQSDHEKARAWVQAARAAIERAGAPPELRALLARYLGSIAISAGKPKDAIAAFEEAVEMATSARGKTHHDVATAMSNLGIAHRRDGNGAKAKELQSSALTLLKAEPDKNVVAISVVRSHLATTLKGLGERDAAQAELEKALAIQQRLLGPNNQNTTQTLDSLGALAYAAGDYSTAKKHWVLALQGRQLTLGPAHRLVADSLANLGLVQSAMGAIDGAINSYKRVVEIRSEVLDATHPDLGETYNNLGTLYRGAGDNEKAAGAFQQAHDIYRAAVGEEHPLVAVTLVNLGDLDAERGDTNEAISKYLGAAQLFAGKREHVGHLAYCLTSLAYAHVDTEGWGEAVLAAEQAVSIRERILAPARSVADSRFALAQGLRGLGRARRAREEGIRARNGFDTAGDSEATKTVTAWLKKK